MTEITHKKGSKIYCIDNNHFIGEIKRDLNPGDIANCDDISWQEGKKLFPGDMPKCKECGSPFYRTVGRGFIKYYIN